MLQRLARKTSIAFLLVAAITVFEVTPGYANQNERLVKVAFVGVRFENLKTEIQNRIESDILRLMVEEKTLEVLPPQEVVRLVGRDKVMELENNLSKDSLLALAASLQVDYVFAGQLRNESSDTNRTLLAGRIVRVDRPTSLMYTLEVVRYYEEFSQDLVKIKLEFVTTIVPPPQSFFLRHWPVLVLGGIAVAGMIALILGVGRGASESGEQGSPQIQH